MQIKFHSVLKKKTEMVIFKSKENKFEGDLKIKLCHKRLAIAILLKVSNTLGVKIDTNRLHWQYYV